MSLYAPLFQSIDLDSQVAIAERAATLDQARLKLRDYQENGVSKVFESWQENQSSLVVAATGTGKTVLFSEVIRRGRKTLGMALVVAHRQELIDQAARQIYNLTGLNVEIEMADRWADHRNADVVVASIQTLNSGMAGEGRMSRFDPQRVGMLIIDEAHHSTADSYRKVIDYFRRNPRVRILGVTATPDRADEQALGLVYESVAFVYEIENAINDGWLVPIMQRQVFVNGLDLSSVRTTAGDLNGADLAAVMEFEENLHGVAHPTIELAGNKQTLLFASSLAHAERLAEIINRHKPGSAEWVHGGTPAAERKQLFARFADRDYQFLANVGIVTEGTDLPGVEVVAMARPTKSRALYSQCVGRGTRPAANIASRLVNYDATGRRSLIASSDKPNVLIVDFVGNSGKHKLIGPADILGGRYEEEVVERAKAMAQESEQETNKPADIAEQLELAKEAIEREQQENAERMRRAHLKPIAHYSTAIVDAFDKFNIEPERLRGWDVGQPSTASQIEWLVKKSKGAISESEAAMMSRKHATQLLEQYFNAPPSEKQLRQLARFKLPTDIKGRAVQKMMGLLSKYEFKKRPPQSEIDAALADAAKRGAA